MSRRKSASRGASRKSARPRNEGTISVVLPNAPFYGLNQWLAAYEAGTYVNFDESIRLSPVYCAMDTIVRYITPCAWNVYDVKGRERDLRPDDNLAYLLNTRANPWVTAQAFREALLWSALGYGNGYAEIQFDQSGRVAALWNIDPLRVQPIAKDGELVYRVTQVSGGVIDVEPWRIYHLRNTAITGYVGDNPIARAARSIATAAAAQQFAAAYFANGTVLSGFFTYPKTLNPKDKETLEKDWREKHGAGGGVKHKSPILPPGMEWKPLSNKPDESQLLESREFSVADVARWFAVPLHLLMDPKGSQGYGTNIEQSGIQFVNGCLYPWAKRHEDEADYKLLPARPVTRETKIDLSRHTKGPFDTRMKGYAEAITSSILSQNEVREMEGWNTVGKDGDTYYILDKVVPVERMLNPPEPAAPIQEFKNVPGEAPAPEDPKAPGAPAPTPKKKPGNVARIAIALDRFERRMSARKADLEKHAPDKVEANLAEERKRLMPTLVAEIQKAAEVEEDRIGAVVDAVLAGEPVHLAAERLAE